MEERERLNRSKSIRKYCIECCRDNLEEVRNCISFDCTLREYRFGKNPKQPKLSKSKAIREHCLNCSGFHSPEVRNCQFTDCYLYRYRMGVERNA